MDRNDPQSNNGTEERQQRKQGQPYDENENESVLETEEHNNEQSAVMMLNPSTLQQLPGLRVERVEAEVDAREALVGLGGLAAGLASLEADQVARDVEPLE